jgi:hypothetical protein
VGCRPSGGCHFVVIFFVLTPGHCLTAPKVWGLGNIAGDSTQLRDHVLSYSFVEKLAEMILQTLDQGGNKMLIRNATWTLSNCVRGKPRPSMEVARMALPILSKLIHVNDDETMADAAYVWGFFYGGEMLRFQWRALVPCFVCACTQQCHVTPFHFPLNTSSFFLFFSSDLSTST